MTSEQRNEIAMEVLDEVLTEATRYAKETHKKAEKDRHENATSAKYGASKKSLDKAGQMRYDKDASGPVSQKLMKKYNKQGKYALSRHENISRDTIDTGRKAAKGQDVEYNKAYGRFKACDQPGRYEY